MDHGHAHDARRHISRCSSSQSSFNLNIRQHIQPSANNRISELIASVILFMNRLNKIGSSTMPCATPEVIRAHWDLVPLTTSVDSAHTEKHLPSEGWNR